ADDQPGDTPVPGEEEQGEQPGDGKRYTNEVDGEIARVLVARAPVPPDATDDRKAFAARRRFGHGGMLPTPPLYRQAEGAGSTCRGPRVTRRIRHRLS